MFEGKGEPLTETGLQRAAAELGVELAALWAVMTVETKGCGFLPSRRPTILFERHIFRKRTNGRFDMSAPDLSNVAPGGYGATGAYQYDRLGRAVLLDRAAALESTSWGLGQVMGFNATAAGFSDVEAMVLAMSQSEDSQFEAVLAFIQSNALSHYLQQMDWARFAANYNGPSFKKNRYDSKLALAFARFRAGPLPDLRVRAAQLYLTYLDYSVGAVDGWYGDNTQKALLKFQKEKQLELSGSLDDSTFSLLQQSAMTA